MDARGLYLKVVPEELVIQLCDFELIGFLPVHDPGASLALWIYQYRVSGGSGDHDAVLNTQIISWQTLQVKTAGIQVCTIVLSKNGFCMQSSTIISSSPSTELQGNVTSKILQQAEPVGDCYRGLADRFG